MAEVETPLDVPVEEQEPLGGAMETIRHKRNKIIAKDHLELLVPGYEGTLKVKYRALSDGQHDEAAKRVRRAEEREDVEGRRESMADVLILHCDRIYVRESDDAPFQELEQHGEPLKFESRLASLLDVGVDTARAVVLEVFSPKEDGRRRQPDAIALHVNAIFSWREGRENEIDEALLGE
jgi:hypothetical protein